MHNKSVQTIIRYREYRNTEGHKVPVLVYGAEIPPDSGEGPSSRYAACTDALTAPCSDNYAPESSRLTAAVRCNPITP